MPKYQYNIRNHHKRFRKLWQFSSPQLIYTDLKTADVFKINESANNSSEKNTERQSNFSDDKSDPYSYNATSDEYVLSTSNLSSEQEISDNAIKLIENVNTVKHKNYVKKYQEKKKKMKNKRFFTVATKMYPKIEMKNWQNCRKPWLKGH